MLVLVGFETSGMIRQRLRNAGVNAYSCDTLPADDNSKFHFQCDIWKIAEQFDWDFGIFHPPCTYLTNAAAWAFTDPPYHQKVKPGTLVGQDRRDARERALEDVTRLMKLPYPHIIENPRGYIGSMIRKADQIIQPYQFGDDASKATCLWFSKGLKHTAPTKRIKGRLVNYKGKIVERWSNQTDSGQNKLTPSKDRWKERSKTYPGIADAIVKIVLDHRDFIL